MVSDAPKPGWHAANKTLLTQRRFLAASTLTKTFGYRNMTTHLWAHQCALSAALAALLTCQFATAQSAGSSPRTWTSKDGRFSINASLVSFANRIVKLQKGDGDELDIPVDRLSFADQEYISSERDWGRVWRNRAGKALFVAQFETIVGDRVKLTAITGKTVHVKLSALDAESREMVQSRGSDPTTSGTDQQTTPGASSMFTGPFDPEASEKTIRRRIADCVAKSRRIRIDGNAADWRGLPTLYSSAPIEDGSRDIVGVAIAPRESDLLVMIQTRQRPSTTPYSFYIRVDFYGQPSRDFQIGLSTSSAQKIKVYDEANRSETIVDKTFGGVNVKIRDVIEAQIPYAAIAAELPQAMAAVLAGDKARPFIRVEAFSFDHESRQIADHGPASASFRFLPKAYPLDGPPPGDVRNAVPFSVPFDGKWLVGHGAMGYITHLDIHAYDFYIVDHRLKPARVVQSTKNRDYYSWERPIRSPIEGRVTRLEKEHPDAIPTQKERNRANKVVLAVLGDDSLQLRMLHFKQSTIGLEEGQKLKTGDPVALCGNSGLTGFCHLHMDLTETTPESSSSRPIAFEQAIVSLNPVPNDPWTRYVENWEIRAGVFVETSANSMTEP